MEGASRARFGISRLLEQTGSARGAADLHAGLLAFAHFLLLHLTTRDAIRALEDAGPVRTVWASGFGLCLLASFWPRALRAALLAALGLMLWKFARIFPNNSNHFFLEFLCLFFLSLVSWRSEEDQRIIASGLGWIPILVMFWSGANKLLYGTYFNGAFLGSILHSRGFAFVFSFFLPEAELTRLVDTAPPGPYAFEAPLALLVSNGIWLGEISAGVLLLVPRLRLLGLCLSLLLLVGIEAGAREILFGLLLTNLLMLYQPARWSVVALGLSACTYALAIGAKLGWLSGGVFN